MQRVKADPTTHRVVDGVCEEVIEVNDESAHHQSISVLPSVAETGRRNEQWHNKMREYVEVRGCHVAPRIGAARAQGRVIAQASSCLPRSSLKPHDVLSSRESRFLETAPCRFIENPEIDTDISQTAFAGETFDVFE